MTQSRDSKCVDVSKAPGEKFMAQDVRGVKNQRDETIELKKYGTGNTALFVGVGLLGLGWVGAPSPAGAFGGR